jgi:hypothetical protein
VCSTALGVKGESEGESCELERARSFGWELSLGWVMWASASVRPRASKATHGYGSTRETQSGRQDQQRTDHQESRDGPPGRPPRRDHQGGGETTKEEERPPRNHHGDHGDHHHQRPPQPYFRTHPSLPPPLAWQSVQARLSPHQNSPATIGRCLPTKQNNRLTAFLPRPCIHVTLPVHPPDSRSLSRRKAGCWGPGAGGRGRERARVSLAMSAQPARHMLCYFYSYRFAHLINSYSNTVATLHPPFTFYPDNSIHLISPSLLGAGLSQGLGACVCGVCEWAGASLSASSALRRCSLPFTSRG